MSYNNRKRSPVVSTVWLALAVFFIVFGSCPVKKYIRLQLYKNKPVAEKTADGNRYLNSTVKEWTLADRHQHVEIGVIHLVHDCTDNLQDYTSFFVLTLLAGVALLFFRRQHDGYQIVATSPGQPVPIPVFLWVRHLQV